MSPPLDLPLRLALHRTPGIGPAAWARLVASFGPPEGWSSLSDTHWQTLADPRLRDALFRLLDGGAGKVQGVAADLDWLAEHDCHVLFSDDDTYPRLLCDIHQPPPVLFVKGNPACLHLPQVAVVGTRHPTRHAVDDCHRIVTDLVGAGLAIASGLAMGIDAAAHEATLAAGGVTLAVLAHGLDTLYPPRHRHLAGRIVETGALVSEFPVGVGPRPEWFPRRNRIISGLSLGVWVVEGALQSGSMITAREALEQGREVFAMPGSIRNPLTRGCHRLIRQGAKLVEQASDIIEELGPLLQVARPGLALQVAGACPRVPSVDHPDPRLAELLSLVASGVQSADALVDALGVPVAVLGGRLGLLVIEGRLSEQQGLYWCV